jgi:hypothetical protein
MSLTGKSISVLELKQLLHSLNDRQPYTCIRVRLVGQLWQQSFMHVSAVYDDGVLLHNERDGRFLNVGKLSNIMQFEIDHSFQNFAPHNHYDVILTSDSI